MKKRFSKYDFNYGYRHYKGFKELSTEDKRKFLSDWQTIALHPILSCDENWILFFDNMTEKDFFESWASQDYMHPLYSQIAENSLTIKKCQERFERYKATNNESKCNKIDKKIAKLLLERQNLLELKKKIETGKQINIAIDANNISEKYVNKIIKLCDNIYSHNCPEIKIMVASSDKSIDSKIEYYYTQEQLQCLSKLQEKLEYYNKDHQADCELRFCELLYFPTSLEAYKQLWDLEDVKKANQFNTYLLVYEKIKPTISVQNNYDKYIIKGSKNAVSLIFLVEKYNTIDKVLKILNDNSLKATFFIDGNWFEENNEKIIDLIDKDYTVGNLGYNYNYNVNGISWMNTIVTKIGNQKNTYCYLEDENNEILSICQKNNSYTIKPNIIVKNNPLITIKQQLVKGSIISLKINDNTITELPLIIEYINSRGLNIVNLEELLDE